MAKFQESSQLSLHFKWTTAKFREKLIVLRPKWTYLLDPPLIISCLCGAFMKIIYEWTSTLSIFPEAPRGN